MSEREPSCQARCCGLSGEADAHRRTRWEEMFPDELQAVRETFPVCYLPYGICEPHGPQNAIGLDALKAHALCVRAAEAHGGVVAPPVFWHVAEKSALNRRFMENVNVAYEDSFLTCIPTPLFLKTFLYQLRAVTQRGFRAVIAVTGHYGGVEEDMRDVAAAFHKHCPVPHWVIADWQCIHYRDFRGDHAGVCETGQLWALRPDLVDISRLPDEPGWRGFASSSAARAASRREGDAIVASQVANLGDAARRLLVCAPAALPPTSYETVEDIWDEYMSDPFAMHGFLSKTVEELQERSGPRLARHPQDRVNYQGRMPPRMWEAPEDTRGAQDDG